MSSKMKLNFKDLDLSKAKETIDRLVSQAKESAKVLELLQQEGLNRARAILKMPSKEKAQKMTNDKIIAGLKKIGLATRNEVRDLEKKVEELASELRTQINQVSKAAKKKKDGETEVSL